MYITPEALQKSVYLSDVLDRLYDNQMIQRFVIDEAHCISEWGHSFRPSYRNFRKLKQRYPGIPIMALTATATPSVCEDILSQLSITNAKVFRMSFNRPNLNYQVHRKRDTVEQIVSLVVNRIHESGIVYCSTRMEADAIANELNTWLNKIFKTESDEKIYACPYHGGLPKTGEHSREEIQLSWIKSKFPIVCATVAFGMGINKPDVRYVIHYTLPSSIENYYQETGRSGRDGKPADCILFYSFYDYCWRTCMIQNEDYEMEDSYLNKLNQMAKYCEDQVECRRVLQLRYFGESFTKDCCGRQCDNCQNSGTFKKLNCLDQAKQIFSLVLELIQKNIDYVAAFFCGKQDYFERLNQNHATHPLFGTGKYMSTEDAEYIIRSMIFSGYLEERLDKTSKPARFYLYKGRNFHTLMEAENMNLYFPVSEDVPSTTSSSSPNRRRIPEYFFHDLQNDNVQIRMKSMKLSSSRAYVTPSTNRGVLSKTARKHKNLVDFASVNTIKSVIKYN